MALNTLLPETFLAKVASFIPSHLNIEDFIDYSHRPLRKSIRVNTLKISIADFVLRAQKQQWKLTPIPWCEEGFWLERPEEQDSRVPLGNTFEHLAGLFYIQEASSMMPPAAMANQLNGNKLVLDIAAAPGSKTTQIAAYMQNKGTVIANEFSSSRLKGLYSNIQRCGIQSVSLTHFDGRVFGDFLPNTFDAVLLDTPCGGEGTVRKDPEAMNNWSQQAVEELSQLQKQLIISAFIALKPGGRLVYSTCTLSPEENQQVCQHLIDSYSESVQQVSLAQLFTGAERSSTPEGYLHVWPQTYDSEGFFVACFEKKLATNTDITVKKIGKFPFQPIADKTRQLLVGYLAEQFDYRFPTESALYQRGNEVWLFPPHQTQLIGKLKCDRMGIKIAELFIKGKKSSFRCSHQFMIYAGSEFGKNCYELDQRQLKQYYQGRDIPLPTANDFSGELLLTHQQIPLGGGKWLKSKIKNALPRELVRDSKVIF